MSLADVIEQGWKDHARQPQQVAEVLRKVAHQADNAQDAADLLRLATHLFGQHLHDWSAARQMAETVSARLPADADRTGVLMSVAVAQWMAGDAAAALTSQSRLIALAPTQALVTHIRFSAQLVQGLVADKRLAEAAHLYDALLQLAGSAGAESGSDRALAVASNNLASQLLDETVLEEAQTLLMLRAAEAALLFWQRAGTWLNQARAYFLLALVHNKNAQGGTAREHAQSGLALIAQHEPAPVDEAFLRLALAHALHLEGETAASRSALAQADALAADFIDAGRQAWYAEARARLPLM
ncbi:hypothetical protein HNQ50_004123 [Silvimonas terrae]|uniref:MalT-like TPR region domain-containing protein n=1 Tax=Silvimonas terrae TaxID=300266 RepID=A0A840RI68_9NEIS|nr:hypothetical protein [Silvimonas terrae]MBB5193369.1 hypothetical protein [Silvimonas terrae]